MAHCRVTLVAVLLLTVAALAQTPKNTRTGNELLRQCNEMMKMMDKPVPGINFADAMHCLGYIDGAADFAAMGEMWSKEHNYKQAFLCVPVKAERRQLVRVVVRYMNEHPKELHKDKAEIVALAFSQAFHCE